MREEGRAICARGLARGQLAEAVTLPRHRLASGLVNRAGAIGPHDPAGLARRVPVLEHEERAAVARVTLGEAQLLERDRAFVPARRDVEHPDLRARDEPRQALGQRF
jgi:hypothetical protein